MKQKILAVLLAAALGMSMGACSSREEKIQEEGDTEEALMEAEAAETEAVEEEVVEEADKKAAVLFAGDRAKSQAEAEIIREALEEEDCLVSVQYAEGSVEKQAEQLARVSEQGFQVVAIQPVDVTALSEELLAAQEAEITLLSYEKLFLGTEALEGYITFDHYEQGVQLAEQIIEAAEKKKAAEEQPFYGELLATGETDCGSRITYLGLLHTLTPYVEEGAIVLGADSLAYETALVKQDTREAAAARCSELLQTYEGREPDFICGTTDEAARGICKALEEAGYQIPLEEQGQDQNIDAPGEGPIWPLVAGTGYSRSTSGRFFTGKQAFSTYGDREELAQTCADAILGYLSGETSDERSKIYDNGVEIVEAYVTGIDLVDQENEKNYQ